MQEEHLLSQPTREIIYKVIYTRPGIHFRGLARKVGKNVGVVQHHLKVLLNKNIIAKYRNGRYSRYYVSGNGMDGKDAVTVRMVASILNSSSARKMLLLLLEAGRQPHKKVAETLGFTSQAITWHYKNMTTIVVREKVGRKVYYELTRHIKSITRKFVDLEGKSLENVPLPLS